MDEPKSTTVVGLDEKHASDTHASIGSADGEAQTPLDPAFARKLLFRRDLLLIPINGILYMIMFLDRTNIANARIEGLEKGLKMPATGYNTALWIFYIPFVLAEVPSNLLLNKGWLSPRYFLGLMSFILGILSMCQGLTHSYQGLLGIRFLMGIFEVSLPAGSTYMISMYYTKRESAPRFAWFFSFALAGPMFSGLLAYAIENLDGKGGLAGWSWIFVIEGLVTIVFSIAVALLMPNFPENAQTWFLPTKYKTALLCLLERARGAEGKESASDNVPIWKVLIDWRIHLFTMCFFCCDITASSMSAFMPTILTELGWTSAKAQLMTMPVWATGIVSSLAVTYSIAAWNIRWPFMLGSIMFQMVGWIIMIVYPKEAGIRYLALFFMSMGTFPQMPTFMAWLSGNLRGRKYLAVGMAWMVGFGNCANFVSSNVFIKAQAPRYRTGFINGLCWTCVGFLLTTLVTLLCRWENAKRDRRLAGMTDEERERDEEVNMKYLL